MMKKKVLSLAVAGALAGVGGAANAAMQFSANGSGHVLLVPYFSTQNGNSTLLNIVNTDTTNGKAVKIRFRGGRDSDDIFDFQVFLSPADVWTANISQGSDGVSRLTTSDNSCTLPAKTVLNTTPFPTSRLSTADQANGVGTREGYIEIFNMADITTHGNTTASRLFNVVKHASTGVPTCTATTLEAIETGSPSSDIGAPTAGLMANWTIINVPNTTVFTGEAEAISATGATKIVYSRQTSDAVTAAVTSSAFPNINSTFDGVLLTTGFLTAEYDFPDVSTPYEMATTDAGSQIYALSGAIARARLINEYLNDSAISAKTDWLVSMPTRRYLVSGRGNAANGVTSAASGTYASSAAFVDANANASSALEACVAPTATGGSCTYASLGSTAKLGAQAWFRSVTSYAADGRSSCVSIGNYSNYDREEQSTTASSVVVSPGIVTSVSLCGEINILSLNNLTGNTGAVGANLVVQGLNVPYSAGWATVNLASAANTASGLPAIGKAFVKAVNPAVSAGVSGTFGGSWNHRW